MRLWFRWQTLLILALTLSIFPTPTSRAASPFAGTWKVVLLQGPQELTFWMLEIRQRRDRFRIRVVDSYEPITDSTITDPKGDGTTLSFALKAKLGQLGMRTFQIVLKAPKGVDKPKSLRGQAISDGSANRFELRTTDADKLDPEKTEKYSEGTRDLLQAAENKEKKEQIKTLRKLVKEHKGKPIRYMTYAALIQALVSNGESIDEVNRVCEEFFKLADSYGPAIKQSAVLMLATNLGSSEHYAGLAVSYAKQLEKDLTDKTPASERYDVIKALATGLKTMGKKAEAAKLEPRLAKLNHILDEEFESRAIPFKPRSYVRPRDGGKHVAVVELFTGAQCPPCVAADVAFDAALKAYQPRDVVLLQYHLHVPGPDALTNKASEARSAYYESEVEGTPTFLVDGQKTPFIGGTQRSGSEEQYNVLRKIVNQAIKSEKRATIQLKVTRKGDKVTIQANVSDLKKTGKKTRLRLFVVQDVVRYVGRNGQRLHRNVVRAMPGGAEGFALEKQASSHSATFALTELSKKLEAYLRNYTWAVGGGQQPFEKAEELPVKIKDLKVIAFVQDDETKKIFQAQQAEVPSK